MPRLTLRLAKAHQSPLFPEPHVVRRGGKVHTQRYWVAPEQPAAAQARGPRPRGEEAVPRDPDPRLAERPSLIYLASTSSSCIGQPPTIGIMTGPEVGGLRPIQEGRWWASDNGCFTGRFNPERFVRHLERLRPYRDRCLFVAAPDVPRNAQATLERYGEWAGPIRAMGFPVAYVLQDGAQEIPPCDYVFLAGSDAWRFGPQGRALIEEAARRGLPVHVGRVNSGERTRLSAADFGATSVDGTYTAFAGVERGLRDIHRFVSQGLAARARVPLPLFPTLSVSDTLDLSYPDAQAGRCMSCGGVTYRYDQYGEGYLCPFCAEELQEEMGWG
ncbi:hypothetical protein [Calidithermus chliarophilus]|uniref:hypothetical protein n=1 Tax=Calidithermus chliarophilus TaxID=52023 RepID=UPI00041C8A74|nr:hypothetical protein [Calidithermus chliarophilus]